MWTVWIRQDVQYLYVTPSILEHLAIKLGPLQNKIRMQGENPFVSVAIRSNHEAGTLILTQHLIIDFAFFFNINVKTYC